MDYGHIPGAMNQLARNLACEWAIDNIRVNSVCPWFITTPLAVSVRYHYVTYVLYFKIKVL